MVSNMFEIQKITLENELKYDNTAILKYTITYPKIISNIYMCGIEKFNHFNQIKAFKTKLYAEKNLFAIAKQDYEYKKSNGYPIFVYELILDFFISYNDKNIISLYQKEYTYTGGAHGSTIMTAQNWNILIGKQFLLYDCYKNDPNFLLYILQEINHQIDLQKEINPTQYFDNSCQLVLNNFKFNQFYLTEKNIAIFFQSYYIAPYSSGIPVFFIPK